MTATCRYDGIPGAGRNYGYGYYDGYYGGYYGYPGYYDYPGYYGYPYGYYWKNCAEAMRMLMKRRAIKYSSGHES